MVKKGMKQRLLQESLRALASETLGEDPSSEIFFQERAMISLNEAVSRKSDRDSVPLQHPRVKTEKVELMQFSSSQWVVGLVLSASSKESLCVSLSGFSAVVHLSEESKWLPPPCTSQGPPSSVAIKGVSVGICIMIDSDWSFLTQTDGPLLSISCQITWNGLSRMQSLAEIPLSGEQLLYMRTVEIESNFHYCMYYINWNDRQ